MLALWISANLLLLIIPRYGILCNNIWQLEKNAGKGSDVANDFIFFIKYFYCKDD